MNSERFILGDPRFLSGGKAAGTINYSTRPPTLRPDDDGVTSEVVSKTMRTQGCSLVQAVQAHMQVHRGLSGYHHRPPLNLFLREGEEPTAGIEIETVARRNVSHESLENDLMSNWFHFEHDGSLPSGGYELITEPLPPHVYRDPHVWAGLQNTLTPWVESFEYRETGLHVHVGLRQFEDIDCGISSPEDRRALGKFVALMLYFAVLDRAFVDRVMLRRNTHYCAPTTHAAIQDIATEVRKGAGVSAREFSDAVVKFAINRDEMAYRVGEIISACQRGRDPATLTNSTIFGTCGGVSISMDHGGEGSEMNASHPFTVEFRRGKGTLHSLSVHRIVELATLTVRYAASILRKPVDATGKDVMVTPAAMYSFIARNTNSAALRQLAEKELGAFS